MSEGGGNDVKTLYTNVSPVTLSYSITRHFFYLCKHYKPDRAYICVWDSFVYEHPVFLKRLSSGRSKQDQLMEHLKIVEGILCAEGIDYKIIYLSEAWGRMFKRPTVARIFSRVLSRITFQDIKEKSQFQYTYFDDFTLAKMNYIIADYLIATYLAEIFPEIASGRPSYYLSGERFKAFAKTISAIISDEDPMALMPAPIYVPDFPFIRNPANDTMPGFGMNLAAIREIVEAHYGGREPVEAEVRDIFEVFSDAIPPDSFLANEKRMSMEEAVSMSKGEDGSDIIAENLHLYFSNLRDMIRPKEKEPLISLYITDGKSFDRTIKPLNTLKLAVLTACDGKHTSFEIASQLGVPLPTVSVYFSRLRALGMISAERRPKRLVKNIVIDLDNLEATGSPPDHLALDEETDSR